MPVPTLKHAKGRPKKVAGQIPSSRLTARCWTFERELRKDKLIDHIKNNVVWVIDENKDKELPADKEDVNYINASERSKKHTDYLREKSIL